MKVLYVIDQNIEEGKTSGIIYKIKNKISLWKEFGVEVELLSLYSFKRYNSDIKLIDDKSSFEIKKHGRWITLIRLMLSSYLLNKFLKKNPYDLMYIRQRPYMPFTKSFLKRVKTIVELNTDDVGEYKALSKMMFTINNYTRHLFYSNIFAFVSVSAELCNKFCKEFNKKCITIANGIEVNDYPEVNASNERPRVIFVGSPGFPWHGMDKFLSLANECPEFDFHIVGSDGENKDNIYYHGYCSLDQTIKHVQDSDVGICSLSLHLNDMNEASPLKSRQYMAQGLPIIYAYKDTDLSGDEEFALKIKNSESNISDELMNIKNFINFAHNNKYLRHSCREFAKTNLDVFKKEQKRIEFFKEL